MVSGEDNARNHLLGRRCGDASGVEAPRRMLDRNHPRTQLDRAALRRCVGKPIPWAKWRALHVLGLLSVALEDSLRRPRRSPALLDHSSRPLHPSRNAACGSHCGRDALPVLAGWIRSKPSCGIPRPCPASVAGLFGRMRRRVDAHPQKTPGQRHFFFVPLPKAPEGKHDEGARNRQFD